MGVKMRPKYDGFGCLLSPVHKTRRRRYSTESEANEWVLKELLSCLLLFLVFTIYVANSRALYSRVTGEPLSLRVGSGTGSIRAFKFTNTRDGAGLGYIVLYSFFMSQLPPIFHRYFLSPPLFHRFLSPFFVNSLHPPLFFVVFSSFFINKFDP